MSSTPCRDCQTLVPAGARGCPRCARNLEFERVLGKFLTLALAAAAIVLIALFVWLALRAAH